MSKKNTHDRPPKHPLTGARVKNIIKSIVCNPFNLLTLISFILLFALVVVPLLSLIKGTFVIDIGDVKRTKLAEGTPSMYYWNYLIVSKMAKSMFWRPLWNSLIVSLGSTVLAVPIGAILAWLMVRSDLPFKRFISYLIIIPYMVPSWCKAQAWLSLFRNAEAGTPGLLYWMGIKTPDWFAYGPVAITLVLALHYYAFTYILVSGNLGTINSELEEMALIQGAGKATIIRKITLPLVLPAFLSGTVMTLSKGMGGYGVSYYLGARVKYYNLAIRLHDSIANGSKGVGYGIAILMIAISSICIFVNNRLVGTRKSYATVNGKGGRGVELSLGKWRWVIFVFVAVFLIVAVFFPLCSLVLESFQRNPAKGLELSNLTTFNWIGKAEDSYDYLNYEPGLLRNSKFTTACWNTVKMGFLGAALCSLFGQIFGYISVRGRGKWYGETIDQLVFIPYLIPSVAFSAVFAAMFIKPTFFGLVPSLYGTFALLLLVSVVKYFPFASKSGSSTMMQISSELEEAAMINGAGFFRRIATIVLPLAKNGFMSGFILTFINIAKEFDLISLLVNNKNVTLSFLSSSYTQLGCYTLASASSVTMIVLVSVCYFLAAKLFGADITKTMR